MTGLGARLRDGEPLLGAFVKSPDATLTELLAVAGYDLLVADLEHSALGLGDLHDLARAGAAAGVPLLARIPPAAIGDAGRILEAGVAGLQLSGVEDPAALAALWRATRFPPDGARSCSTAHRGARFGRAPAAADLVVVAQVESAAALEALPALLAARPAPGAWFLGPVDLSVDLGHPGEVEHPDVRAALGRAADAILAAGARLGVYVADEAGAAEWRARGATLVVAGSDLSLLMQRADTLVRGWRDAATR